MQISLRIHIDVVSFIFTQCSFFPTVFFCRFVFKGIVHPKMHIQFQDVDIHPRCRWVCFFIGADLKKSIITSLAHQWSSAVNGCRQNESWESVCNKQIHLEDVFCFKPLLLDQLQVLYPYLVKEIISAESGEKYAHNNHYLQFKSVLNKYISGFWWENKRGLTITGIVWIQVRVNTS